jgi:hypothetical protein
MNEDELQLSSQQIERSRELVAVSWSLLRRVRREIVDSDELCASTRVLCAETRALCDVVQKHCEIWRRIEDKR